MVLGVNEDVAPSSTDTGLLRLVGGVAQAEPMEHSIQKLVGFGGLVLVRGRHRRHIASGSDDSRAVRDM